MAGMRNRGLLKIRMIAYSVGGGIWTLSSALVWRPLLMSKWVHIGLGVAAPLAAVKIYLVGLSRLGPLASLRFKLTHYPSTLFN
jgi:hypothetical protein